MAAPRPPLLLAEDDPNDAYLFQRALSKVGADVPLRVLPDGESALAYLCGRGVYADRGRHPFPGMLVTDIKLPARSGLELLEHVRARPDLPELPIVVLSSSAEPLDLERARDLGANAYYEKPPDFEALCRIVRAILKTGRSQAGGGPNRSTFSPPGSTQSGTAQSV